MHCGYVGVLFRHKCYVDFDCWYSRIDVASDPRSKTSPLGTTDEFLLEREGAKPHRDVVHRHYVYDLEHRHRRLPGFMDTIFVSAGADGSL